MARTIATIYNEIITEKETKATLAGLLPSGASYENLLTDITSQSKVANWRLWVYIHSFATWVLEKFFDQFKADVTAIKNRSIYGTELWWIDRMFDFQYGYNVQILESESQYTIGYPIIDETAKIIKAAALFTNEFGQSTIKVAKLDSGNLVRLSILELEALNGYRAKIQPAGATINVISLNSDDCELKAEIYYNPLFDLATVQTNVKAAINNYFKNLDFGGIVNRNSLIDELQDLQEVSDIVITSFRCAPNGQTLQSIGREYEATAGYIEVSGGVDLDVGLTYIPI